MIEELIQSLTDHINEADAPVLAWSGGRDSSFLLQLILELDLKVSVLTFHHLWTKQQRQFVVDMIDKHGLSIFFYAPIRIDQQDRYVTADYNMGGTVIRRILDHVPSDKQCGIDAGKAAVKESLLQPQYIWDLTIVGTKATDTHNAVEKFEFDQVGYHRWLTPLWSWTDDQVKTEALARGYDLNLSDSDELDTGNFVACMACLQTDK